MNHRLGRFRKYMASPGFRAPFKSTVGEIEKFFAAKKFTIFKL